MYFQQIKLILLFWLFSSCELVMITIVTKKMIQTAVKQMEAVIMIFAAEESTILIENMLSVD